MAVATQARGASLIIIMCRIGTLLSISSRKGASCN